MVAERRLASEGGLAPSGANLLGAGSSRCLTAHLVKGSVGGDTWELRAAMSHDLQQRLGRIYAAVQAGEEQDMSKLKARVGESDRFFGVFQDFSGGLTVEEMENLAYSLVHNIANVTDHARRWAKRNGKSADSVDSCVQGSFEIRVMIDLSNNDKHGYPPRGVGYSGRSPKLVDVRRVLRLTTGSQRGSGVAMTLNRDGTPRISGSGSAKAVLTGEVLDGGGTRIGDLDDLASRAVEDWERILRQLGALSESA
jgi:hypothetical protein